MSKAMLPRFRFPSSRRLPAGLAAAVLAGLAASLAVVASTAAAPGAAAAVTACSPSTTLLASPRKGSKEVQAKALNDRGDIVGFADAADGTFRAILWKGGKPDGGVDLGVLPGYVSSEAYGITNDRVVYGVLYDKQERIVPFRWEDGRMTALRGPDGRVLPAASIPDRNAINERGEIAGTLLVGGNMRAVRWTPGGKATFLPGLPGHAWTNAWSISDDGVVSGWSRKLPNEDGENNPVLWTKAGKAVALKTPAGRADGAAESTNRSGLTVGYLGNLGTDKDPESDQAAVWRSRAAEPQLMGKTGPLAYAELTDVNDRGQAVGMVGRFSNAGFPIAQPAIWRTGWASLKTIAIPAVSRKASPITVTQLNDVNARGAIVGNVFGLRAADPSTLQRIDPVHWTCAFGA